MGVVPGAGWVFGIATMSLAVLPLLVADRVGRFAVAVGGVQAGLTLFTGVAVQPSVKRFEQRHPDRAMPLGLLAATVGLLLGAAVAVTHQIWLLLPAALVCGTAYGLILVSGLTLIERHLHGPYRAPANAVFYSLTYVGFGVPYLVAELGHVLGSAPVLAALAVLPVVALVLHRSTGRAEPTRPDEVRPRAR